ncbi:hypothetical protein [Streptomyces sp. B6B3]|uniref:hypothetical protein n=1 Tax=Streptomyces sp. B6B3 TaxID=3153570 RepID=UPI00325DA4A5
MDAESSPPTRPAVRPAAGLAWLSTLLGLTGALLALHAATESTLLLILFALVALTTFVAGVVLAARWTQAQGRAQGQTQGQTEADAARLDELEPLPPDAPEPPAAHPEDRP